MRASERNAACGTAGEMGAVCSRGGGDAVQPFSAMADSTAVETKAGDQKGSIGAAAPSSAVEICAAALVEELKVNPKVALRFARARNGNFSKAAPFLRADLAWRAQKTPVIFGAVVLWWCFVLHSHRLCLALHQEIDIH